MKFPVASAGVRNAARSHSIAERSGTAYSYTQPGLLVCWEKVKGIFEGQ